MKQNRVIAIVGKKGYGKTTLIERLVAGHANVLWCDCLQSYSPAMLTPREFEKHLPGFVRGGDLDKTLARISPDFLSHLGLSFNNRRRTFNLVHHMGGATTRHAVLEKLWEALIRRYEWWKQETTVVLDEVQMYLKGSYAPPVIRNFPALGRNYRINQLYAVRRPMELHTDIRSNADDWYIFQVRSKTDLKFLLENTGLSWEDLQNVSRLGIGQYAHYDVRRDRVTWLLKDPPPVP